MELHHKVAIVTGASKGIGLELTKQLAAKGVSVAAWSRTAAEWTHPNVAWIACDIADEGQVEKAFQATLERFGPRVDILINNAGFGIFKKMEEFTSEEWHRQYAVNVHGIYYATKRAVPVMRTYKNGHIINVASIAAKAGMASGSGYNGSKFAVRGISESLYREVKDDNIKVTCIFPGSVDTGFFDEVAGTTANPTMLHADDVAAIIIQQLETPDNFNTSEVEIRPMRVKYSA